MSNINNKIFHNGSNSFLANNVLKNQRSLRILIFVESFYPVVNGISTFYCQIVSLLAARNHKVHLLTGIKVN